MAGKWLNLFINFTQVNQFETFECLFLRPISLNIDLVPVCDPREGTRLQYSYKCYNQLW